MTEQNTIIGYIVGGGLKESFRVRLTVPSQEVQEGAFVVIESGDWQFYGLVTDLQLGATDPRFADEQETRLPPELAKQLHGHTLFTNLEVLPALMLEKIVTMKVSRTIPSNIAIITSTSVNALALRGIACMNFMGMVMELQRSQGGESQCPGPSLRYSGTLSKTT